MSRCKACDVRLNDKELTLKDSNGIFYDLCFECLGHHWEAKAELEDTYQHDIGLEHNENELSQEESGEEEYGYIS